MNFVLKVNEHFINKIITFYQDYKEKNPSEHILFFAKTDQVAVTIYKSGKVMFQGEDAKGEYDFWIALLNNKQQTQSIQTEIDYYYSSIGSDETGKGDLFGPIVVCAAYLPKLHIDYLIKLGIKDSKTLSDSKVKEIAKQLIPIIPHSVIILPNNKYNDLVDKGYNINKMLAHMHNRAIFNVIRKIKQTPEVILDQFTDEKHYFRYLNDTDKIYRKVTFLTKAESKYASVAIASIIARHVFLEKIEDLKKATNYNICKGASKQVDEVLQRIICEQDEDFIRQIAKLNFNNIRKLKN